MGRAKAWAILGGVALLERSLASLAPHVDRVVVAAPSGMELPAGPYERVDDVAGAAGPLAGLCAALSYLPGGEALVLGVDYPLVSAEVLAHLRAHPAHGVPVIPRIEGKLQPLVARYPTWVADLLRVALGRGERSLVAATEGLHPVELSEVVLKGIDPPLHSFLDVDDPTAFAYATRVLSGVGT